MDSVEGALRFLQRQFASVANEEAAWRDEKAQLQQRVRELEEQRAQQEQTYKEAMLRVKMLEFALRQERGRYLVSPAPVTSAMYSMMNGSRREERSGITRPMVATVTRTVERRKTQPPSESPHSNSGSHADKFRTEGAIHKGASMSGEGMEISRPRLNSRNQTVLETSSSAKSVEVNRSRAFSSSDASARLDSQSRAATGSQVRPITVSKSSFRPLKVKLKLTGHMDAVRSVSFHPSEPLLVSGSEDCTVRVWNLASAVNGPPSSRTAELDPMLTVRSHTSSVLAVTAISAEAASAGKDKPVAFASAGRDGSITLIGFPLPDHDKGEPYTYEEYQGVKINTVKRAHEDAIWDIHAHPMTNVLFSAGADGIVRTWALTQALSLKSELRCTSKSHPRAFGHNFRGTLLPTSVCTMLSDSKTCVVGYTNSAVAQFDFHSEQLIQMTRPPDGDARETRDSQVNCVISHPTMPIAIAAGQDRKIRFYDMRAGDCVASILAHEDAVSSVSIDSSGLYLASGGHDGSLRIWSVADHQCVFEQAVHRAKWGESTHAVAYHPSRNFVATSGADGALKIFQ